MVEEGLFERFPCDEVYGLHNWPDLPAGHVAIRPGPIMAAADEFKVTLKARGGHAAMPHKCNDPVVLAAQLVTAFQTLVSRRADPLDAAVVSVTQIHAGSAFNVIPEEAWLGGTVRSFRAETQDLLESEMRRMVEGLGRAFGIEASLRYRRGYPATVNHEAQAETVAGVAGVVVGQDKVHRDVLPVMGAEDFSYMLKARPGAYFWLGQAGGPSACSVHNPRYDFNDEILPIGASLFATLVETQLKASG
jgi:hippurate hydrolase